MSKSATAQSTCPECQGALDDTGNETTCRSCGLVVDEQWIDHGPDWRTFDGSDQDQRRVGAPRTPSLHDHGLGSSIGHDSVATGSKRQRIGRQRSLHKQSKFATKAERNQAYALSEIRRIAGALDLADSLRDQAAQLLKTAQGQNLIQGRSLEGFAGACLYAACRINGLPRTREDIDAYSRCTPSQLENGYEALQRDLGIGAAPIDAKAYIPRFASELDVSDSVERRATTLCDAWTDANPCSGRAPSGVAAACLYCAIQEQDGDITQGHVAAVADTTPHTLRDTIVDLRDLTGGEDA